MRASEKLERIAQQNDTLLCIGLDPEWERIPTHLRAKPNSIFEFNRQIIESTYDLACAYKLQSAHYEARGIEGLTSLQHTLAYLRREHPDPVTILDAKRGDIPNTNRFYAQAMFEYWNADATTVIAYTGLDALEPFTAYDDRLTFVVVRSSNPGARAVQDLRVDERAVFEILAQKIAEFPHTNLGAVVGATYPDDLRKVRTYLPERWILVPGIGAQGGAVRDVVRAGLSLRGSHLILNASRSIIFASSGEDFADAARQAARKLCDEINVARQRVEQNA
jgi:orotidine 5'-phosphate decarboxylase subfamily 2